MYINELELNNIVYSVDKIRLKTYLSYSVFTELEFRFKVAWSKYVKKYYTTPQLQQFFYNYNIEIEEGKSFWFGFCHNNERRSFYENAEYNFTIEFNPNKLKDNDIIKHILSLSGKWFLKSFDLACDIKININDLITDTSGRQREVIFNYGFDNKTVVLGKGDGRVKIYNKKIESNLKINGDLTRVEVTREVDDFPVNEIKSFNFDDKFPKIYLNNYIYSLSDYDDMTLFAILYAVQNGFPIKQLTKTYKRKIKNMLEGGHKIRFSNITATQVVLKTIYYYFINNNKVRWK